MQTNFAITLSAQVALERRLATVAHNIANMNTVGFRAEGESFEAFVSRGADLGVSYTVPQAQYISLEQGELTKTDNPLDVAPIGNGWLAINTPTITRDGMIVQGKTPVGSIGVFSLDPAARLTRNDTSSVLSDRPATPVQDFTKTGLVQGFTEGANINPVLEMAKMMEISRAFEQVTNTNQVNDQSMSDAIKTLGSNA